MQWLKDRALSLMLFAIGFSALGVTVAINKFFGVSQAATAEGQMLSGSIAVIIDLALVALGIAAGALLRSKEPMRKAIGGLAFVLMLACALASVVSVLGFLGAERLSVSKAQEKQAQIANARIAAQAAAEKAKLDAQIALAKDNAKWMQTQTEGRNIGRTERKEMRRDAIEGMTKSVEAIGKAGSPLAPAPSVDVIVKTDEQVEMIASLMGINKQTAQLTILAYVSILVIVLKSSLFPIGAYVWKTKEELPQSVTDPIRHGLPDEAHVTVMASGPALEPPPGQKMLPAPLSRPEPPPEGKAALARIGFPKVKPDTERAMTDEEKETVGIRMLAWLTANAIRGEFAADGLWALFLEFFAAQGVAPMAERYAKPALEAVCKGRKRFAESYTIKNEEGKQRTRWNIRLPDFEELNGLLDKAGFPAAPKASRTKAERVDPKPADEAKPEEAAPATAPSNVISAPFAGSVPAPAPSTKRTVVKGLGELQRLLPNLEAMRCIGRVEKSVWQSKMQTPNRKSLNRFSRARSA